MCDDLKPHMRNQFLEDIKLKLYEIEYCYCLNLESEELSKKFHHLKGLLSYFNDLLMEEAYYFEMTFKSISKSNKVLNRRQSDKQRFQVFVDKVKELISK